MSICSWVSCARGSPRGEAAVAVRQTVGDQRQQLLAIGLGQTGDGRLVIALGTEAPAQLQRAAVDLAIDTQPVRQRRIQVMGQARRGVERLEQRRLVELLVELAEVVEGDPGLGQGGHALTPGLVGQVAQHTVALAFVRHLAQLFLDALDRRGAANFALGHYGAQAQWVGVGEPADAAGQVHVLEQTIAAMAFQLHQHLLVAAPLAQCARQGGQQQIVDLGVVGRRRLL